ncbi:hypothetical protein CR513_17294, partial [Mucuna pruriens]
MWVNQTTSNKENVVEHPSTSQLDQDIQAFSKEKMVRLRALLNSTSKPLGSCDLTIKVSKKQPITIANGDHVPIIGFGNVQLHSSLSLHNVLHWDNGTKFVNLEFSKFLKDNGVVHELMCVNTPQQNRSFFVCPPLQGESYLEVEPIIESLPFPTYDVQVQVQEVTKPTLVLEQVQMSEPNVSIPDNSIEKQVQLSKPEVSIPDNSIEDVTDDMPIALRKGKRLGVKYPISQFVCIDHLSVQHQAMKEEMKALEKNSTWEIVDRPKDKRVVGCRWIYTVKCKSEETLE